MLQHALGMREAGAGAQQDITFELVLHLGTFLSVILYFRHRLVGLLLSVWQKERIEERKMILWLIMATIPATAWWRTGGRLCGVSDPLSCSRKL